jgi:membrane protein EpsK
VAEVEGPVVPPPEAPDSKPRSLYARRMVINTLSNWVGIIAQIAGNMFLIWYVNKAFDARYGGDSTALFGIYRLAVMFSFTIGMLSFGMSGSVIRLASESIAVKDWKRLSATMSVARTVLIVAGTVGVLGVVVVSFFLLGLFRVPEQHQPETRVLFQLTAVATALGMMYTLYRGLLQAHMRYELANASQIIEIVSLVALIVLCFRLGWVGLEAVGASYAVSGLVGLVIQQEMVRRVLPDLHMAFRRMTREAFHQVFSFGGWVTVNMVSRQALELFGTPLVSATAGPGLAGIFNIPQTFALTTLRIVGGLTHTLWPVAARMAIRGERDKLARLYLVGTRMALMVVAPIVAILVAQGQPFIVLWAGPDKALAYGVTLVYMGLTFLRSVGLPAEHIVLGSGRIVGISISRLVATVLGIGLALAAAVWTDYGLTAVAVALVLPEALRGVIFLPIRMTRETGVPYGRSILEGVAPAVIGVAVTAAIGSGLRAVWVPASLPGCLAQMALTGVFYAGLCWFLLMRAEERAWARSILRRGVFASSDSSEPS